jgi:hypothetical protein
MRGRISVWPFFIGAPQGSPYNDTEFGNVKNHYAPRHEWHCRDYSGARVELERNWRFWENPVPRRLVLGYGPSLAMMGKPSLVFSVKRPRRVFSWRQV